MRCWCRYWAEGWSSCSTPPETAAADKIAHRKKTKRNGTTRNGTKQCRGGRGFKQREMPGDFRSERVGRADGSQSKGFRWPWSRQATGIIRTLTTPRQADARDVGTPLYQGHSATLANISGQCPLPRRPWAWRSFARTHTKTHASAWWSQSCVDGALQVPISYQREALSATSPS